MHPASVKEPFCVCNTRIVDHRIFPHFRSGYDLSTLDLEFRQQSFCTIQKLLTALRYHKIIGIPSHDQLPVRHLAVPLQNRFVTQMEKFVAAVQGKGEVAATGEQGVILMEILDAIYKSSDMDCEVDI